MPTPPTAITRRFLRWEYVPEAVLLAGLTAFLLDQTDAATSAFKSTKALVIMGVVGVGWLGARLVLARLVPFALPRAAVFSVASAVALAGVVLPAYDNETVIESFPTAAAAAAAPAPAPAPTTTTLPATAVPPTAAATPTSAAPPAAPVTTTTTTATTSTTTTTTTPMAPNQPDAAVAPPASEPAPAPETTAAPAGPQRLRSGPIRGIDHRASGTAVIYRQPEGRYVVGLEDIDIQPGPDYDLYVVPGENREDTKGGVRLGDLRGNRGTQFYEVPDGVDLEDGPWTVLVWCQTFAVPVAGSTPN